MDILELFPIFTAILIYMNVRTLFNVSLCRLDEFAEKKVINNSLLSNGKIFVTSGVSGMRNIFKIF